MPKKVVYLLGSGATQGVIRHSDNASLLTRDIQAFIRTKREEDDRDLSDEIWNEIVKDGRDVEHLITVLDCLYKYSTANQARNLYHEAIVNLAGQITEPLQPNLYTFWIDLHLRSNLSESEELTCILSLNYEDILERSIETHLPYRVDYALNLDTTRRAAEEQQSSIRVLKLHGSFNWRNDRPVTFGDMTNIPSDHALWIPPGVDKKKEHYPFNVLWGRAVELVLAADVLRVVGCSLSRNDWALIPIIYSAQALSTERNLRIELIDYTESVQRVLKNYPYMEFVEFVDLPEIQAFRPNGLSRIQRKSDRESYFSEQNAGQINIFDKWLKAKIEHLYTKDDVMRDDLLRKSDAKHAASYFTNVPYEQD